MSDLGKAIEALADAIAQMTRTAAYGGGGPSRYEEKQLAKKINELVQAAMLEGERCRRP